MKRGKKALIQDYTWDKSTRKEEWRKCNMLVVHKGICSKDVRGKLLPRGINQARDLVSSLDALGEAYVIEYWELRPKGRTVLSALIQCISRDRSWLGGQCSRGRILAWVLKLCPLELKWR